MRFVKWLLNNFWLKVMSLALAMTTWFYVAGMIDDAAGKNTVLARLLPSYSRFISKKMYVEAVLVGELPEGCGVNMGDVLVDPPYLVMVGPKFILNNVEKLQTTPIDISEYRKTTVIDTGIAPISQSVDTGQLTVKVAIPIFKSGNPSEQE